MSKRALFIVSIVFVNNILSAKSWAEILYEKKNLIKEEINYQIITGQYLASSKNMAPTIAASVIKEINIIENGEELIDVRDKQNLRISMLPDAPENKPFVGPIYNSGLPSASKMRKSIWHKLENMLEHLDNLAPFFNYKPGSIVIKVFEGLRDLKTQEMLFNNKFDEIKASNTSLSDDEVYTETAKWISPVKNNVPVHSTGAAVDIRLYNTETKDFVDAGKFGVIWGTNNESQTFEENISDEQKLNRLYLLMAASKAGLVNYVFEHWHFSAGDRYAAYWQQKDVNNRIACYSSVK